PYVHPRQAHFGPRYRARTRKVFVWCCSLDSPERAIELVEQLPPTCPIVPLKSAMRPPFWSIPTNCRELSLQRSLRSCLLAGLEIATAEVRGLAMTTFIGLSLRGACCATKQSPCREAEIAPPVVRRGRPAEVRGLAMTDADDRRIVGVLPL